MGQIDYDRQHHTTCSISGCNKLGRLFAQLGELKIAYCPTHRKKGELILNEMLKSKLGFELNDFVAEIKKDMLDPENPLLSEESNYRLGSFINVRVKDYDEIQRRLKEREEQALDRERYNNNT